jgi:hypothetical protein
MVTLTEEFYMTDTWKPTNGSPIPEGPPRLFSMVTTLTSRAYTPCALRSFFETTGLRSCDRFILINNDDPNVEELSKLYQGQITLVHNKAPQSFAANANSMIEEALRSKSDLYFMNNDIIYSDNWLTPLVGREGSILSPLSNREVQYIGSVTVTKTHHMASFLVMSAPMKLEEYLGSPRMFQAIAEAHAKETSGFMTLSVFPFFCVKLPLGIMQALGRFDEGFGRAGGEDYDYCLRAWLAGFKVEMVLGSYLLHFWGKSTWNATDQQKPDIQSYNTDFLEIFRAKWGDPLFQYVLQENDSAIVANPEAARLRETEQIGAMVRLLMPKPVDLFIP